MIHPMIFVQDIRTDEDFQWILLVEKESYIVMCNGPVNQVTRQRGRGNMC